MSGWTPVAPPQPPTPPPPPPSPHLPYARPTSDTRRDLRAGAVVIVALALAGAVLGLIWAWWSPPTGAAFRRASDGVTWLIDENESSVAADGRFAVLTLGLGLVAGIGLYLLRPLRGPIGLLSLALGCLLAAQTMRLVGWLAGGGSDTGPACRIFLDQVVEGRCVAHTKLSVHAPSLYFLGAAVAVLVHALLVSFSGRDDLGRRDPIRLSVLQRRAERAQAEVAARGAASVGEGSQP